TITSLREPATAYLPSSTGGVGVTVPDGSAGRGLRSASAAPGRVDTPGVEWATAARELRQPGGAEQGRLVAGRSPGRSGQAGRRNPSSTSSRTAGSTSAATASAGWSSSTDRPATTCPRVSSPSQAPTAPATSVPGR